MSLIPGTVLGPYEISGPLGAGVMVARRKANRLSSEEIYNPYSRSGTSVLTIVDADTGAARNVIEPSAFDAAQPSWSPSGERLVFWSNPEGQRDLYGPYSEGAGS